ncbi:hypothetical protein PW5551_06020 [Petrotoga sp. 9PW.55.5.1]|uniref:alanyl-tRNA editing protein n=1 Tax=Petrotoga sp. 9PW.55.5.1 TaxID=1308979 RepID=UPI000DC5DE1C|nr:alanyl-tRNA editing protein [Petrotoga sp. 9PW.55.5.1]RAO99074.1 hypothetical protein PW5551_06020 [Petrotoga sp. 9PW.55.5.1]
MNRTVKIKKIFEENKEKGRYIAYLEDSPFYPDGKGGQLGDRGKIDEARILEVTKDSVVIDKYLEIGNYTYKINEERREDISKQHTAQHILSAAFEEVASIKTLSFRMDNEYSTIDLDREFIDVQIFKKAETLSNEIIARCIKVEEIITSIEDIKNYKLRKPLSQKISGDVRLIKIGDFDTSACGGFHVKNTGNINLIKILNSEKIKGNLTRVYFVAGTRALNDYSKKDRIFQKISQKLTSGIDELEKKIENIIEENKESRNKIRKISEYAAFYLANELKKDAILINNKKVIYCEKENEAADFLYKYVDLEEYILCIYDGESKTITIFSKVINCKDFIEKLKKQKSLQGGGSQIRGNIKGDLKKEELLKELELYN